VFSKLKIVRGLFARIVWFILDVAGDRSAMGRRVVSALVVAKFWGFTIPKPTQVVNIPNSPAKLIVNVNSSESHIVDEGVTVMLFVQEFSKLFCDLFTHILNGSDFFFFLHHWSIKLFLKLFGQPFLNIDLKLTQRFLKIVDQWLNDLVQNLLKFSA
jgi:hypothetical protein